MNDDVITLPEIEKTVAEIVEAVPVYDIHTHLYDPAFGDLLLWGVDELLTYHYLVAEVFRRAPLPYDRFWSMPKKARAEYIWEHLFLSHSPLSESCRGVLTTLQRLGVDTKEKDLDAIRKYFSGLDPAAYADRVFETANVEAVVMTNNPFDEEERAVWERGFSRDPRFKAALRLDPLLVEWPECVPRLREWGYPVSEDLSEETCGGILRFLGDWHEKTSPLYTAISLPPDFTYPDDGAATRIIDNCILPFCRERNLPFAMMIGVKKRVNPALRLAGDGVGKGKIESVENLCARHPGNKFLLTYLSRENQHEACIAARKFHNLMLFGCWWFLNNPSIIEEITRERIETLGTSFIPQHSDARVLDQLVYKWAHSREIIARVLAEKYADLVRAGWLLRRGEVERDVTNLFSRNFTGFLERK